MKQALLFLLFLSNHALKAQGIYNIKIAFVEKTTNEGDKKDFIEIINYINNSNWKTDYDYQYNFIKSKVLFDFKLD